MGEVLRFDHFLRRAHSRGHAHRRNPRPIYFERRELQRLVALYSENVMAGEWRDYAIDHSDGLALFSIFQRSGERPLYVIAKQQVGPGTCEYLLFEGERRARRAGSLEAVLDFFRRRLSLVT